MALNYESPSKAPWHGMAGSAQLSVHGCAHQDATARHIIPLPHLAGELEAAHAACRLHPFIQALWQAGHHWRPHLPRHCSRHCTRHNAHLTGHQARQRCQIGGVDARGNAWRQRRRRNGSRDERLDGRLNRRPGHLQLVPHNVLKGEGSGLRRRGKQGLATGGAVRGRVCSTQHARQEAPATFRPSNNASLPIPPAPQHQAAERQASSPAR